MYSSATMSPITTMRCPAKPPMIADTRSGARRRGLFIPATIPYPWLGRVLPCRQLPVHSAKPMVDRAAN